MRTFILIIDQMKLNNVLVLVDISMRIGLKFECR